MPRLTKRVLDSLQSLEADYFRWCSDVPGFGVRVGRTGAKSFVLQYRAQGGGRAAPTRRLTIGATGGMTTDQARQIALDHLAQVRAGGDPATVKRKRREALTVAALAELWMAEHVQVRLKPSTSVGYTQWLRDYVLPAIGSHRAEEVSRSEVARLHSSLKATKHTANTVALAVVSSMYSWAQERGLVPSGCNPAKGVSPYEEGSRTRYLTEPELKRLGVSLRLAEADGLPWIAGTKRPSSIPTNRVAPAAIGAIRLLLLSGMRVQEVLTLEWAHVDFAQSVANLADSKTGAKIVILSAPALAVIAAQPRIGRYIFGGVGAGMPGERPRSDVHRPFRAICRHAGIAGLRVHDLRHSFASVRAGGGLSLPILGGLLGHSSPRSTARYAHLANSLLRTAANTIAGKIAADMGNGPSEGSGGQVIEMRGRCSNSPHRSFEKIEPADLVRLGELANPASPTSSAATQRPRGSTREGASSWACSRAQPARILSTGIAALTTSTCGLSSSRIRLCRFHRAGADEKTLALRVSAGTPTTRQSIQTFKVGVWM